MKIAFVDEVFYPIIGGGEIFVREVGKRLVTRGHEVYVLTSRNGGKSEETLDGIKIIRLDVSKSKLNFLFRAPKLIRKTGIQFDIINSTSPISRFVCNKIKGNSSFVGNIFAYWGDAWVDFNNPISAKIKKTIEDRSLKKPNFDILVSSNKKFLETAKKLGIDKKIEVVPSGVDLSRFSTQPESVKDEYGLEDKKVVLFVGRVIDIKGLKYLIAALEGSDYALVIVGDGPELPNLTKAAEKKKVTLIAVGQKDPIPFYFSADLFVLPSIMEGCPLTILEAFAAGLPVVASNVAGIPELVEEGKNGFLVKPKDTIDLRKKIDRILMDDNLCIQIKKNNLVKAKNYSWDKIAEKMEKIYGGLKGE